MIYRRYQREYANYLKKQNQFRQFQQFQHMNMNTNMNMNMNSNYNYGSNMNMNPINNFYNFNQNGNMNQLPIAFNPNAPFSRYYSYDTPQNQQQQQQQTFGFMAGADPRAMNVTSVQSQKYANYDKNNRNLLRSEMLTKAMKLKGDGYFYVLFCDLFVFLVCFSIIVSNMAIAFTRMLFLLSLFLLFSCCAIVQGY